MIAPLLFKRVDAEQNTVASDASVSLDLTACEPGQLLLMAQIRGLVPATDAADLHMTLNAESSGYKYHVGSADGANAAYVGAASNSDSEVPIVPAMGADTGENTNLSIFIPTPESTALYKHLWFRGASIDSDGVIQHNEGCGMWGGGLGALTSLEIAASTGNLASGDIDLWELTLHKATDVGKSIGTGPARVTLLDHQTASAAAWLNFDLSTATYPRYALVMAGVVLTNDGADLYGQVGTAGGIKSATYKRHASISDSGATAYAGVASSSGAQAHIISGAGNVSGEAINLLVEIPNPSTGRKLVAASGAYQKSDGDVSCFNGLGAYVGDNDILTTYRVIPSASTIASGTFLLYGIGTP